MGGTQQAKLGGCGLGVGDRAGVEQALNDDVVCIVDAIAINQ